jgi:hypothetical protein
MQSIAPPKQETASNTLEKRLWEAADLLRANSSLTAARYSTPVLGLIFPFVPFQLQAKSDRQRVPENLAELVNERMAFGKLFIGFFTPDKLVMREFGYQFEGISPSVLN